jgi:SNF2 family DNA or RNA helicase
VSSLRPKQQEVIDYRVPRFVHADPPGTGKTPVGWSWLSAHGTERTLIVAPRNVLRHWEQLGSVWAPEYLTTVSPVGSSADKRRGFRTQFEADTQGGPAALIIPYTTLREDIDELLELGFDSMLCDEAHKLKKRDGVTHLAALKIARRCEYLDLTTASPILNRAEEAWSAMRLIDPKRWPSFWRWAREHFNCYYETFGGRAVRAIEMVGEPLPGALEQISHDFGELLVMRDETELGLELPDVVEIPMFVDLSPAERRLYNQMAKHFWMEEGDTVIFASNMVSKLTRLRQLSSDWGEVLAAEGMPDGTKVVTCCDIIIDELQGKSVVVFAQFKGTCRRIVERLREAGITAALHTGDETDDERDAAKQAFVQARAQVIVGTDSTMAEGMDGLQHVAHHMVIVDPDWVPEITRQKIGRLKRDGQQATQVFVWFILANNSVDQYVDRVRDKKQDMLDVVLGQSIKDVLDGNT